MEREDSPDWLHTFQAPQHSPEEDPVSESSPSSSPVPDPSGSRNGGESTLQGFKEKLQTTSIVEIDSEDDKPIIQLMPDSKDVNGSSQGPSKSPAQKSTRKRTLSAFEATTNTNMSVGDDDDGKTQSATKVVLPSRNNQSKKKVDDSSDDEEEWKVPSPKHKKKVHDSSEDEEEWKVPTPKSKRRLSKGQEKEAKKVAVKPKMVKGPSQSDAAYEMSVEPLSQMSVGRTAGDAAAPSLAAKGVEPAAKKKKPAQASELTGDSTFPALTDTAEFLSQEPVLIAEEAVGEEAEEGLERRLKPRAASSLPLIFGDRILRSKVLLECDGDALDLSGDMGAVGRFSVCQGQAKDDEELLLDLKGVIYKTTIVPSNTFFLVEAIMNDFVQLQADTDRNEMETMVEGTMEGFTFESDEEGERPTVVVPGTEATGSKDAPDDDDDGAGSGDIKAVKKKKTPAKTIKAAKAPGKQRAAGKSKTGRSKASAKGSNSKKATTKKAARPKTSKSAATAGK